MAISNLVVILFSLLFVGAGAIRLLGAGHPENGCGHGNQSMNRVSDRFYDKADRPAGPDAEDAALERDSVPPMPPTLRRRFRLLKAR